MVQTLVASGLGQPGLPETLTSQIVTFNVNVILSSNSQSWTLQHGWHTQWKKTPLACTCDTNKGRYSSSWEPHLRATGRHLAYGITQCYLPPDTSECAPPNPSHAGWYSIYLPRRDGRVSWPSWLESTRPGVEPATFRSKVRCRTAAPPRQRMWTTSTYLDRRCTGRFRGLREVQVVRMQTGGTQPTRTC